MTYSPILHVASGTWFVGRIHKHRVEQLTLDEVDEACKRLNAPATPTSRPLTTADISAIAEAVSAHFREGMSRASLMAVDAHAEAKASLARAQAVVEAARAAVKGKECSEAGCTELCDLWRALAAHDAASKGGGSHACRDAIRAPGAGKGE